MFTSNIELEHTSNNSKLPYLEFSRYTFQRYRFQRYTFNILAMDYNQNSYNL